jgi:nitrate/nitrite-specific signal transduction histidine kinase
MAVASAAGSIRMASPYQLASRVGSSGVYADSVVAALQRRVHARAKHKLQLTAYRLFHKPAGVLGP